MIHQTLGFPKKVANVIPGLLLGLALVGGFNTRPVNADSPLTSTDLASAYADIPQVRAAQRQRSLDPYLLAFLVGDRPLDEKAAVINAIGWQLEGTHHSKQFLQALAQREGKPLPEMGLKDLSPEDQFVLGYLLALDDYQKLSPLNLAIPTDLAGITPIQLLSRAAYALPDNFTVQFVRSIVAAQYWFDQSWCAVYLEAIAVLRQFPPAQRNLRPQAVDNVMNYLDLYQDTCRSPMP